MFTSPTVFLPPALQELNRKLSWHSLIQALPTAFKQSAGRDIRSKILYKHGGKVATAFVDSVQDT